MDQELLLHFDESINLESNVADLYVMFQDTFPEDADFWKALIIEERSHAALLKNGKEHFAPVDTFPVDLLSATLEELKDTNNKLIKLISQYQEQPPSREAAFNMALQIEHSAGEIHFQQFMQKKTDSHYVELFQRINGYDKDHESRIRTYMEDHTITIGKCNS
ncbi:rubrerythrin family protein [Planctomycetota bacterium]